MPEASTHGGSYHFSPRQRFTDWFRARQAREAAGGGGGRGGGETVQVWPDTFTDDFRPEAARAAVRVLEAAGFEVAVPPVCWGAADAPRRTAR